MEVASLLLQKTLHKIEPNIFKEVGLKSPLPKWLKNKEKK